MGFRGFRVLGFRALGFHLQAQPRLDHKATLFRSPMWYGTLLSRTPLPKRDPNLPVGS